jgi:hypothetical protein
MVHAMNLDVLAGGLQSFMQLNTSYGIAYNSLLQAITVQLTHPTAYLAHHTRVGWRER